MTSIDTKTERVHQFEYPEHFRPGMGTENVGPFLRSLIHMVRPNRVLEIGAGYTTPFIHEALINNEKVIDDGNLNSTYFNNYHYSPKLVLIDDMSLGNLKQRPGMSTILNSQYTEFIEGKFQGKANYLIDQYGLFDFVWFDCGGSKEYADFFSEYWQICSCYNVSKKS